MKGITRPNYTVCARCLRFNRDLRRPTPYGVRHASEKASPQSSRNGEEKEQGAMSRRLSEMSDESLATGGRSARKAVKEAGFSDELKAALEEKIANASFRSEHASAFAQANMPTSAGRGTRDIASAQPWEGSESVADATLRMLNDAHKPLQIRGSSKSPGIRTPSKVDTGRPRTKGATGTRLANARDKTSVYSYLKDETLSEDEREKFRKELKDRFQPGARAVPATITGIASLANERIEDAIARGQFKNLPRGKNIERDYNASNPFLDTTEYFMNKIIQRQEIVPPWIEKQQEMVSTMNRFRKRLRADWKRHVARSISSRGGSLQSQMELAEEYAFAESVENPARKKVETLNALDDKGHMSQITLAGEMKTTSASGDHDEETEIKIMEQTFHDDGTLKAPEEQITISAEIPLETVQPATPRKPTVSPFRDEKWAETERSYHKLAVDNLNSITRSYNLMAPDLAKKPYFSLSRELKSCYADVAPLVASAIRDRALAPKVKVETVGHKPGGVLEKFSIDNASQVYDERKPQYGFKQFWKDLFSK